MNLTFANSIKRNNCDVKILRLVHGKLQSDFIISRGLYLHEKFRENKTLAKFSKLTLWFLSWPRL